MMTPRLIWFQHFHKSAGSAIVQLAKLNAETFYPNHRNGNPYDDDGVILPIWEFSERDTEDFVERCLKSNVSFIATEWGCPNFSWLKNLPNVISITMIRDPWTRLKSNYYYDMLERYERMMSISDYYFHHSLTYRQPNYYLKSLYRGAGNSKVSKKTLVNEAMENFRNIDFAGALTNEREMENLCRYLQWRYKPLATNRKPGLMLGAIRGAMRGDLLYAVRRKRIERDAWSGASGFLRKFERYNAEDIAFYQKVLSDVSARGTI